MLIFFPFNLAFSRDSEGADISLTRATGWLSQHEPGARKVLTELSSSTWLISLKFPGEHKIFELNCNIWSRRGVCSREAPKWPRSENQFESTKLLAALELLEF